MLPGLNQKGAVPVLVLVSIIALIGFFALTSLTSFRNKLFSGLYPKEKTYAAQTFSTNFLTYFGGSGEDQIRDVDTDSQGNIYIAGGTSSSNFPTTANAYDRTYDSGSCVNAGAFARYDVFVAKFSPQGQLLWSTLLGGPCYDRAYALEVYETGGKVYLYVTGRAGRGFPMVNAMQPTFQGYNPAGAGQAYGEENMFAAKLDPSATGAAQVVWSTYVGTGYMARDVAVDSAGNAYYITQYENDNSGTQAAFNSAWFTGSYRTTPIGQKDNVIVKLTPNGTLSWATYFGTTGIESATSTIRVDSAGNPVLGSFTNSSALPTTANAFQRTFGGVWDFFVAKFSPDGKNLLMSTYIGGSGAEFTETHSLELDPQNNFILAGTTQSTNFPTTAGAYDRTYAGSSSNCNGNYTGDGFVAKISADGSQLLAGTYVGGSAGEGIEGVGIDSQGDIAISGASNSTNFPVTNGVTNKGSCDVIATKLSSDLTQLQFSTIVGGSGMDLGRTSTVLPNGDYLVAGHSQSSNITLVNPYQPTSGGGTDDGLLAKFSLLSAPSPTPIPTPSPVTSPTPIPSPTLIPSPAPFSSLLGYWSMDETSGTTVTSSTGTNNATATNTTVSPGKLSNSRGFDGTSSYIDIADLDFTQGGFSYGGWFKTTVSNSAQTIFQKFSSGSNQIWLGMGNTGQVVCGLSDSTSWVSSSTTSASVADNNWHHALCVVSSSTIQLYLDGVAYPASNHTNSFPTNNSTWQIGRRSNTTPDLYFTGSIDEIGLWSKDLSSQEVSMLYNSGSGLPHPSAIPSPSPLPSSSPIPGDIDGSRKVDIFDYNSLITNFGQSGPNLTGDLDSSGKVDIFDYNILITNFGRSG